MDGTDPTNEQELIQRAKSGDSTAQDELFRRHYANLHAWIRLKQTDMIRRFESSADLVQSVFRIVLGDLDKFEYRGPNSFRNWLFTYALTKIRNRDHFYRAQRRDIGREEAEHLSSLYGTICSPSDAADAKERVERFEQAFAQLSEPDQNVIFLARIEGASHGEIAERLGTSVAAARQALSRALVRLATKMTTRSDPG